MMALLAAALLAPAPLIRAAGASLRTAIPPSAVASPQSVSDSIMPSATTAGASTTTHVSPYADSMRLPDRSGSTSSVGSNTDGNGRAAHGTTANSVIGIVRTVGALALVLMIIYGVRFALRRLGHPLSGSRGPGGVVEVLGRYPLGRRRQLLILLRVGPRILLIAQTNQNTSTLAEFTGPEDIAAINALIREAHGESFSAQFERLTHHFHRSHAFGTEETNLAPDGSDESSMYDDAQLDQSDVVVDLTRAPKPRGSRLTSGGILA